MPDDDLGGRATFSTVLVGEGPLLIPCAETLLRHGHTIRVIISGNETIQDWAREQKVRFLPSQDEIPAVVGGRPFDYLFSIANLAIIPARILALPRLGAINFHDGPLPRYAGLHATTWAILNRETSHGVTWHEMRATVDTGDILKQRLFTLAPDDTAYTLNRKCFKAGIDSFEELVQSLGNGGCRPVPQDRSERTYFAKYARPTAQACIDWTLPADTIVASARSLDFGPYPNPLEVPKVVGGGNVWLVPKLEVLSACSESPPGTVLEVDGQSLRVATSTNQVIIPRLLTLAGGAVDIDAVGIGAGYRFETLASETTARLTQLGQTIVRHEDFWLERLLGLTPLRLPSEGRRASTQTGEGRATVPLVTRLVPGVAGSGADVLSAALMLYLARAAGDPSFDIGFGHVDLDETLSGLERFFAPQVPLHVAPDGNDSVVDT